MTKTLIRYSIILLAFLGISQGMLAAGELDSELSGLIDMVTSLRDADQVKYDRIKDKFAADPLWTPMSELGPLQASECRSDKTKTFKLNRLLNQAESSRKGVYTHGDMLNGEDSRFDYSLYERTIKSKQTATYSLKKRKGKQVFVVIPFDKNYTDLKVTTPTGKSKWLNGCLVVECTAPKNPEEPISLKVENTGASNMAVAILNYNSRK